MLPYFTALYHHRIHGSLTHTLLSSLLPKGSSALSDDSLSTCQCPVGCESRAPFLWLNFIPCLPLTGFTVTISIYGLHHNPRFWPNPKVWRPWEERRTTQLQLQTFCLLLHWEWVWLRFVLVPVLSLQVFDPSRFAPDSSRHSYAFLPFSGGARWWERVERKGSPWHILIFCISDRLCFIWSTFVYYWYVWTDSIRYMCAKKKDGSSVYHRRF